MVCQEYHENLYVSCNGATRFSKIKTGYPLSIKTGLKPGEFPLIFYKNGEVFLVSFWPEDA